MFIICSLYIEVRVQLSFAGGKDFNVRQRIEGGKKDLSKGRLRTIIIRSKTQRTRVNLKTKMLMFGHVFLLLTRYKLRGGVKKKWYFLVVPTTRWPNPPPPSCGQSTTFLWKFFYLLRIPWYGKIIEQIGKWNSPPPPQHQLGQVKEHSQSQPKTQPKTG